MNLSELPIEDLARGMFPTGVCNRRNIPNTHNQQETDLAIRQFRQRNDIWSVSVTMNKMSGVHDGFIFEMEINEPSEYHVHLITSAYEPEFMLNMPSWITFETFYDQIDVTSNPLNHMVMWINEHGKAGITLSRVGSTEPRSERNKYSAIIHPEFYWLRIHPPATVRP